MFSKEKARPKEHKVSREQKEKLRLPKGADYSFKGKLSAPGFNKVEFPKEISVAQIEYPQAEERGQYIKPEQRDILSELKLSARAQPQNMEGGI